VPPTPVAEEKPRVTRRGKKRDPNDEIPF
jgi:hypothetical protein